MGKGMKKAKITAQQLLDEAKAKIWDRHHERVIANPSDIHIACPSKYWLKNHPKLCQCMTRAELRQAIAVIYYIKTGNKPPFKVKFAALKKLVDSDDQRMVNKYPLSWDFSWVK